VIWQYLLDEGLAEAGQPRPAASSGEGGL